MYKYAAMFFIVTTLCACGSDEEREAANIESAKKNAKMTKMIDAGTAELPGKPGYQVHQYINYQYNTPTHYLYVIEQNGIPVSGVQEHNASGKTTQTVSVAVTSQPTAELPKSVTCNSMDDCKKQLESASKSNDPDYAKYLELKNKYEK